MTALNSVFEVPLIEALSDPVNVTVLFVESNEPLFVKLPDKVRLPDAPIVNVAELLIVNDLQTASDLMTGFFVTFWIVTSSEVVGTPLGFQFVPVFHCVSVAPVQILVWQNPSSVVIRIMKKERQKEIKSTCCFARKEMNFFISQSFEVDDYENF